MVLILILLCMLVQPSNSFPVTIDYTIWDCYNISLNNYPIPVETSNQNTVKLLSTLVSRISTSEHGFVTYGSETHQGRLYGMASCRGDINSDDCQDCVQKASNQLVINVCPRARQAILWKEQCMIRYTNNHSLFSFLEEEPLKVRYNFNNFTDHVNDWIKLVKNTMDEVTSTAASDKSGGNFAAKDAWFSPMNKTLFTTAQCNPDLKTDDCADCLTVARSRFYDIRQVGGLVLTPSCTVRYEIYPFYRNSSNGQSPFSTLAPPPQHIATITASGMYSIFSNINFNFDLQLSQYLPIHIPLLLLFYNSYNLLFIFVILFYSIG